MVLRLFQVKKSAKSLQDPVSKNKKPLFQDIPKNLQKPLQDDDPFRTRAATNPSTAAAGILLFSPDSPNFFPILSLLRSILIGPFLIQLTLAFAYLILFFRPGR